jgi:hypothetical protein
VGDGPYLKTVRSNERVVGEWVWPDPSKSGEARFILHDERQVKLWELLEQVGQSAYGELAATKLGLEALNKNKIAR